MPICVEAVSFQKIIVDDYVTNILMPMCIPIFVHVTKYFDA